jgi:hypothetical protein
VRRIEKVNPNCPYTGRGGGEGPSRATAGARWYPPPYGLHLGKVKREMMSLKPTVFVPGPFRPSVALPVPGGRGEGGEGGGDKNPKGRGAGHNKTQSCSSFKLDSCAISHSALPNPHVTLLCSVQIDK